MTKVFKLILYSYVIHSFRGLVTCIGHVLAPHEMLGKPQLMLEAVAMLFQQLRVPPYFSYVVWQSYFGKDNTDYSGSRN